MKSLTILQKFFLLSTVFMAVLLVQLWFISGIKQDNASLVNTEIPLLNKAHELQLRVVQVQQFLSDISATRGKDGLDDGFREAKKNAIAFRKLIQEMQHMDPAASSEYGDLLPAFEQYYLQGKKMAEAYIAGGTALGNKSMGIFDSAANSLTERLAPLVIKIRDRVTSRLKDESIHLNSTRTAIVIASIMLGILMTVIFYALCSMLKLFPLIRATLSGIANGDISQKDIAETRQDEMGQLVHDINGMKNRLRDTIQQVSQASTTLSGTAFELSRIGTQTHAQVQHQDAEISQVVTAIHEMSATSGEVARSAGVAADSTRQANQQAQEGTQVVSLTKQSIGQLAEEVARTVTVLNALEENSQNIGSILDVIRGIAEQTNLLALNAAIEAARAGDQGRGFAVVADEVRTLAGRTQESTQEIQRMIESLQTSANQASQAMHRSGEMARKSVEAVGKAGDAIRSMNVSVTNISDMNNQIASAAEEQNAVSEEINQNITRINDATTLISQTTHELSFNCHQIEENAQQLQGLVSRFRL